MRRGLFLFWGEHLFKTVHGCNRGRFFLFIGSRSAGRAIAGGNCQPAKAAVAVFGHQHKAVVIVKKLCLVTVWQHLCNIGEAMRKAVLHILGRYVMPAALYAVFDAAEAFFCCVKAHIVQADIIPGFFRPAAQALRIAARKRLFLG